MPVLPAFLTVLAIGIAPSWVWATPPSPCAQNLRALISRSSAELPVLTALPHERARFQTGQEYLLYSMRPEDVVGTDEYKRFLDQTVEVIFQPMEPFGHITLRVGRRIFGFQNVTWTLKSDFTPRMGVEGQRGVIFAVSENDVTSTRQALEKFYHASESHNIPPFDAYSPVLEIHREPGGLRFRSTSPEFGNTQTIDGQLVTRDGKQVLKAPNGHECPVEVRDGRYFVQSFSCSTSATYVLRSLFGIRVDFDLGARELIELLDQGNPGGTAPAAIIRYF